MNYIYQYGHWLSAKSFDPIQHFGFIYLITNTLTEQKYLGKKNFRTKYGKDSGWMKYTSSSTVVKDEIKKYGKENFTFHILELWDTAKLLEHGEIKYQLRCDVLNSYLPTGIKEFYNKHIYGKGFSINPSSLITDNTIYIFENYQTKDVFSGTRAEFIERTNCTNDQLSSFIKDKQKSLCGWVKLNSDATNRGGFDYTIYEFFNSDTNEKFVGNQREFRKISGLTLAQSSAIATESKIYAKSWCLYKNKDLRKYTKDKNIYQIRHLETNQIIEGTKLEISEKCNLNHSDLGPLLHGNRKSVKGWVIANSVNYYRGADPLEYTFYNKNNEIFVGTQRDFKLKFGGDPFVVIKGYQKSTRGWYLKI